MSEAGPIGAGRAWWLVDENERGSKTCAGRWDLPKGFSVVERAVAHRAGARVAAPDQSTVRDLLLHVRTLLEDNLEGSVAPD